MIRNIIKVPTFLGCDNRGVEKAPDIIQMKLDFHTIETQISVDSKQDKFDSKYPNFKYYSEIFKYSKQLSELKFDSTPFMIGGDHSASIGSLAYTLNNFESPAIVWIDAHSDINTIDSTISKNGHGMVLSQALGIDNSDFKSLYKKYAKFDDIYYFGLRDTDKFEEELILEMGIKQISSFQILNDYEKYINTFDITNRNLHISFDIDVLDPRISPGTGLPVKNGIKMEVVKQLIEKLVRNNRITCIDFVEYNPDYDKNDMSLNLIIDLIEFCNDLMNESLQNTF